jgi:DnaJ-domain-containing protein 1
MNPELEKLIELALADGILTDKERQVLQRKAQELGVDQDEFEMVLEGMLQLAQKAAVPPSPVGDEKPRSNKEGDLKKCPSCGAPVQSFKPTCSDCGHEFTNTQANSTLLKLLEQIEKINNKEITTPQILKGALGEQAKKNQIDQEKNKLKSELIENFPIPNTREDILEFLAYSLSKGKDNSYMSYFGDGYSTSGAWRKKAEEVIIKSKIMFKNDNAFFKQLENYEIDFKSSIKSRNRVRNLSIGVIAIILIIVYGGIMLSQILKN